MYLCIRVKNENCNLEMKYDTGHTETILIWSYFTEDYHNRLDALQT